MVSLQSWLGESEEQKKNAATPAYMSVFMSCMFPFAPMRQTSKLTRGFFQ